MIHRQRKGWLGIMGLSLDDAIVFVLMNSRGNRIMGKTRRNKLVARLKMMMIPVDADFYLDKYGSRCSELETLQNTPYYWIEDNYGGTVHITDEGKKVYDSVLTKLKRFFSLDGIDQIRRTIYDLSQLNKEEISDNEHNELLVDIETRFKLEQTLNELEAEFQDLLEYTNETEEDDFADVYFNGIIEYHYHLVRFLKSRKLEGLDEMDYDFDSDMTDYYLIVIMKKIALPMLKEQSRISIKDENKLKSYYRRLKEEIKNYTFFFFYEDFQKLVQPV